MDIRKKVIENNFKIIAVKPGKGCRSEYLKVLEAGRLYTLYNDYVINQKIESITYNPSIPTDLFTQDGLRINVSAIAGQNGAGKSSLIELMFMAINNIAVVNELNEDLRSVKGIDLELYCFIGRFYKIKVKDEQVEVYGYDASKSSGTTLVYNKQSKSLDSYDLNGFFFTIAINYSLYAYNSSEIMRDQDDWLNGLFHKNDSYQTPLVINPWRDKGNIDINSENELVRLRLMANLLRTNKGNGFTFRKPTDNLYAVKLKLTVNKEKSSRQLYQVPDSNGGFYKITLDLLDKIDKHEILKQLNKKYSFKYKKPVSPREIAATDYLIGKLISIALTYDEYQSGSYFNKEEGNFNMARIDKFLGQVIDDPSHIAFKVKQTLNFLRFPYLPFEDGEIDIERLASSIDDIRKNKRTKYKIEELLPPPIFNVDILLTTDPAKSESNDLIAFQTLSSGERQFIYSISSVLYHLINIDSVRRYRKKKKYSFVHVVFEEVELYFHPEMQRCYIKNLLDSIRNIQLETIKGINICFVTHSPFILSDIPDSNVMFLKVVDEVSQLAAREEKTFGANIHDLLADGFFMYNGFCGQFASQKINETIAFLDYHRRYNAFQTLRNQELISLQIQKSYKNSKNDLDAEEAILAVLKQSLEGISEDKNDHYKLIKSIGEPILSTKLMEMYDEVFASNRREILEARMRELQEELDNL